MVRGQSKIVDEPSCLKTLLQLVAIINSCDTEVSNLDTKALVDYLQRRKSTKNFWYVTQTKGARDALQNAAKTLHEYKLVDKM